MELPWESWAAFSSKLQVQQRVTLQAQSNSKTSWKILVSITAPTIPALIHPFCQVMEMLEALEEVFPLGAEILFHIIPMSFSTQLNITGDWRMRRGLLFVSMEDLENFV